MKRLTAIIILLSFGLNPVLARADMNQELSDMFESWGFSTADTPAGAYHGQTRGYYTGGSISARSPVKNFNLVAFNPPSINAGCGGIDFHSGAFSFINMDQFVNVLRAIGQNAAGYAFSLALEIISPTIKGLMDRLQGFMNEINQMSSNSCYMAQRLVNSTYSLFREGTLSGCVSSNVATGSALDRVDARLRCAENPKSGQDSATAQGREGEKYFGNIVWDATKRYAWNNDAATLAMSLLGTYVHALDNGGRPVEPSYWAPTIDFETLVGKNMDEDGKAQADLLTCRDAECLQIRKDAVMFKPFTTMTKEVLESIAEKIRSRNGVLTPAEMSFVNTVPLPILKMLNVSTAYPGLSEQITEHGSQFLAVLIARDYINSTIREVKRGLNNLPKNTPLSRDQLDAVTRDVYETAMDRAADALTVLEKVQQMITYVQFYEEALNDRLPEMLRRNIMFGRT